MSPPTAPAPQLALDHAQSWPRRVLMTADAVGGVWPYALDLAHGFARRGIETLLAVMGEPPSPDQKAAAMAIPRLQVEAAAFALEWTAGAAAEIDEAGRWLQALARDYGPDLIHLNGYAHAAQPWPAPVVVAAHSCVRTWWRAVHGEDPPPEWEEYNGRVRSGLNAADLVIAPTRAFLAALVEAHGWLEAKRVVTNGRREPAVAGGKAGKQPVILCAARLWDEAKNVATLDAAAGEVPWPVYVAGRRTRPEGGGVNGFTNVRPLGPLGDAGLRGWFDRAQIFVSPALYEPFGLAVLEAAQSRCALVLADIPTFRELWDGAAVFVPPRDDRALARTLNELADDPDAARWLGGRAAERARQYGVDAMIGGTLEAYSAAATLRGRSSASSGRTIPRPAAAAVEAGP
ncbi:MAG: glycosyltransferase family 4 protein [Rhodospirillales bacterium]|nr:glycosyltransferase family 4 protein [Rhodospirillales bacterium]